MPEDKTPESVWNSLSPESKKELIAFLSVRAAIEPIVQDDARLVSDFSSLPRETRSALLGIYWPAFRGFSMVSLD